MSRESSCLGLSLHSPGPESLSNERNGNRCWLRYGFLLLTVFAGIWCANAMRLPPVDLASLVAVDFGTLRATSGILIVALMGVAVLGCVTRMIDKSQRGPRIDAKRPLLSITRDPSANFWRAQEEERKQLSRELHDSVGQLLTGVGLQLRALQSASFPPHEMQRQLDEVCRLNAQALRQVRDLAMGLRPALLDDVSLVTALEWQARQFSRQTGVSASLEVNGEMEALPEALRICIYRCLQEALTNCAKHAQARNIRIVVRSSAGSVNVVIEDDGIGFDISKNARGLGLLGMRERVAGVNGTFSVASRGQSGTALTLEIPVPGGVIA